MVAQKINPSIMIYRDKQQVGCRMIRRMISFLKKTNRNMVVVVVVGVVSVVAALRAFAALLEPLVRLAPPNAADLDRMARSSAAGRTSPRARRRALQLLPTLAPEPTPKRCWMPANPKVTKTSSAG